MVKGREVLEAGRLLPRCPGDVSHLWVCHPRTLLNDHRKRMPSASLDLLSSRWSCLPVWSWWLLTGLKYCSWRKGNTQLLLTAAILSHPCSFGVSRAGECQTASPGPCPKLLASLRPILLTGVAHGVSGAVSLGKLSEGWTYCADS